MAVKRNNFKIVQFLLSKNDIDVNKGNDKIIYFCISKSPLYMAVINNNIEIIQFLLKNECKMIVFGQEKDVSYIEV